MKLSHFSWQETVHEYDGLPKAIAFSPDGVTYCYGKIDGTLVLAGEGLSTTPDNQPRLAGPLAPRLLQYYPNPFNPTTSIAFELPEPGPVRLQVYSASGRRVVTLLEGPLSAGRHEVVWSGRDQVGILVASGLYFYRLESGDFSETRVMSVIK